MSDIKKQISELEEHFSAFYKSLDIDDNKKQIRKLEIESSKESFWDNSQKAQTIMQELGDLHNEIEEVNSLKEDINTLVELSSEDELSDDLENDINRLAKKLDKLELKIYLSGPYDKKNAIMSIHAGQGGTEAMDWTAMLFRMYSKYCESQKWKLDMISETKGEEAGIKSITFKVAGQSAYGFLKRESGAHRLVRQSPFNADKLRQTSFALVEVLPELDQIDLPDIEINDDDLEWQFYRASGAGGQNVNKVSTAVRLTHIPTKIVVTAQTERRQDQNRANALSLLRAKLWVIEQEKAALEKREISGSYSPATWGTQIRSYVLHPYKMVKDNRTKMETSDAEAVLDGKLEDFIEAELRLV